jgi:DNA-binding NarL/FixJ family response regulator
MVRDMLRDIIAALAGMEVVGVAGAVHEGIDVCLREKPNLVIIDWMLSDGTGLELVREIREKLPEMRILMLTASEQEGIVRDAAALGVHGFVSKRQSMAVLRETILALVSQNYYYCSISYKVLIDGLNQQEPLIEPKLSDREWAILRAVANGMGTKEMALQFQLSQKTISNHITALKDKLKVQEVAGLVLYALRHGLVKIEPTKAR